MRNYIKKHVNRNTWLTTGDTTALTITRRNGTTHEVLVDTVDVPNLARHTWRIIQNNNGYAYAFTGSTSGPHLVAMHRMIDGTPPELECFFLNHNQLDCRRANLMRGNRSDVISNSCTLGGRPVGQTGHRWIQRSEHGGWVALAYVDGRQKYIAHCWSVVDALRFQQRFQENQLA